MSFWFPLNVDSLHIFVLIIGAGKFDEEDVKELKSVCKLACDKVSVHCEWGIVAICYNMSHKTVSWVVAVIALVQYK